MDKLKDPALVVSVVDLVGLIGLAGYFYKQNEYLKEDILKISNSLDATISKLREIEKKNDVTCEGLQLLNDQVKTTKHNMNNSPNYTDIDNIENNIENIMRGLKDNNINVESTMPMDRSRMMSGRRREDSYREDSYRDRFRNDRYPDRSMSRYENDHRRTDTRYDSFRGDAMSRYDDRSLEQNDDELDNIIGTVRTHGQQN